jgi:transcriptional regulator of acetoin/glycerol metabolism
MASGEATLFSDGDWSGNVPQLHNVMECSIILWHRGRLTFALPGSRTTANSGDIVKPVSKPTLLTREEVRVGNETLLTRSLGNERQGRWISDERRRSELTENALVWTL